MENSPSLPLKAPRQIQPGGKAPAPAPPQPRTPNRPNAKKPDAKKPDAKKPDTKKPDTKKPDTKNPKAKKPDTKKPKAKKPRGKSVMIEIRDAWGRLVAESSLGGVAAYVELAPGHYSLKRVAPSAQPMVIELDPGQRFKLDLEPDGRLAVWTQRDPKSEEFVQGR